MAKHTRATAVDGEFVKTLFDYEETVKARLRVAIHDQVELLHSHAQSKAASVLGVRKGKLVNSIKTGYYENENGIGGRVYSEWFIARFYERGYGGKEVSVKAYTRRVKSRNVSAKIEGRKRRVAMGVAFVDAHSRTLERMQRPFLKPSLEERRTQVRAALIHAVEGVRV